MEEKWLPVNDYDGYYEISSFGRVRSLNRESKFGARKRTAYGRVMKPTVRVNNYCIVDLYKNGKRKKFYIHRLVGKAFIPNPSNYQELNHLDCNPSNNLPENLEWCTRSHNSQYAADLDRMGRGAKHYKTKLKEEDVLKIRELRGQSKLSEYKIAKMFDVSRSAIQGICQRTTWKHI